MRNAVFASVSTTTTESGLRNEDIDSTAGLSADSYSVADRQESSAAQRNAILAYGPLASGSAATTTTPSTMAPATATNTVLSANPSVATARTASDASINNPPTPSTTAVEKNDADTAKTTLAKTFAVPASEDTQVTAASTNTVLSAYQTAMAGGNASTNSLPATDTTAANIATNWTGAAAPASPTKVSGTSAPTADALPDSAPRAQQAPVADKSSDDNIDNLTANTGTQVAAASTNAVFPANVATNWTGTAATANPAGLSGSSAPKAEALPDSAPQTQQAPAANSSVTDIKDNLMDSAGVQAANVPSSPAPQPAPVADDAADGDAQAIKAAPAVQTTPADESETADSTASTVSTPSTENTRTEDTGVQATPAANNGVSTADQPEPIASPNVPGKPVVGGKFAPVQSSSTASTAAASSTATASTAAEADPQATESAETETDGDPQPTNAMSATSSIATPANAVAQDSQPSGDETGEDGQNAASDVMPVQGTRQSARFVPPALATPVRPAGSPAETAAQTKNSSSTQAQTAARSSEKGTNTPSAFTLSAAANTATVTPDPEPKITTPATQGADQDQANTATHPTQPVTAGSETSADTQASQAATSAAAATPVLSPDATTSPDASSSTVGAATATTGATASTPAGNGSTNPLSQSTPAASSRSQTAKKPANASKSTLAAQQPQSAAPDASAQPAGEAATSNSRPAAAPTETWAAPSNNSQTGAGNNASGAMPVMVETSVSSDPGGQGQAPAAAASGSAPAFTTSQTHSSTDVQPAITPQVLQDAQQTEMRVGLHPEGLGAIEIRAVMRGNEMGAAISAQQPETHQWLASHMGELESSLQSRDIQLNHLTLNEASAGGFSGSSFSQPDAQQQAYTQRQPVFQFDQPEGESFETSTNTAATAEYVGTGVDLRV